MAPLKTAIGPAPLRADQTEALSSSREEIAHFDYRACIILEYVSVRFLLSVSLVLS
jgi:hypothetical protein